MKNMLPIFLILILSACNPFPKKDSHPAVQLLADLLKDETKFKKIFGPEDLSEVVFLKDDKILLKPDNSNLPFKITDPNNVIYFNKVVDWKRPFYVDKVGNLYLDEQKYFYPGYKKNEAFKTIVFKDSLTKKSEMLGSKYPDSVKFKMLDDYEASILKPYNIKPCEYTIVNTERCDILEIRNNALIVRQNELFKSDFTKLAVDVPKFDDDVLIRWQNGKVATPIYYSYHQLKKQKFKCDDMTNPKIITLKGKQYLFTYRFGLYLIK